MRKKKPKIVLDSNIIISAVIFNGPQAEVLGLVLKKLAEGVISEEIIEEVIGVLSEKFSLSQNKLHEIEEKIKKDFLYVVPTQQINVPRDPDDNKIIEAAVEGKCSYIVTGDKDLLTLKKYKSIKIVSAKEFLEEFTTQQ